MTLFMIDQQTSVMKSFYFIEDFKFERNLTDYNLILYE